MERFIPGRVLQVLHHVGHQARLRQTEAVVEGLELLLPVLGGHHHGVGSVLRLSRRQKGRNNSGAGVVTRHPSETKLGRGS